MWPGSCQSSLPVISQMVCGLLFWNCSPLNGLLNVA